MNRSVSVIIPNRNGSATIGKCLKALYSSPVEGLEVIVVDDCSDDDSLSKIEGFPCRVIRLERHAGASAARNRGATESRGDVLFFTDADCIVRPGAIARAAAALAGKGPCAVVGGTYTPEPYDAGFFSRFQSVFINHAETRRPEAPDYVASHALAVDAGTFRASGGFREDFLPIIEDVEFSHRMRRAGCRLAMDPEIRVSHIFNFSLGRSLRNALRKTRYWVRYSLGNGDLLADSGTASQGLKMNTAAWLASCFVACTAAVFGLPWLFAVVPAILGASAAANGPLLRAWWRTGGPVFGVCATAYYLLVYPAAVAAGAALGVVEHLTNRDRRGPAAAPGGGTAKMEPGCG